MTVSVTIPITLPIAVTITLTFTMTVTTESGRFLKILKNQENFHFVARRRAILAVLPPYIGGDFSGQPQSRIHSVF